MRQTRPTSAPRTRLQAEALEAREVLSITHEFVDGVLTITGDQSDNRFGSGGPVRRPTIHTVDPGSPAAVAMNRDFPGVFHRVGGSPLGFTPSGPGDRR